MTRAPKPAYGAFPQTVYILTPNIGELGTTSATLMYRVKHAQGKHAGGMCQFGKANELVKARQINGTLANPSWWGMGARISLSELHIGVCVRRASRIIHRHPSQSSSTCESQVGRSKPRPPNGVLTTHDLCDPHVHIVIL